MKEASLNDYDYFKPVDEREEVSSKVIKKKWIRCKEAVVTYSMSRPTIMALATDAGALYKINGTVLIDADKFENYMETFRIPARL